MIVKNHCLFLVCTLVFFLLFDCKYDKPNKNPGLQKQPNQKERPKISFSFDDGETSSYKGFPFEKWNKGILDALSKHKLKAILFVKGNITSNKNGRAVLKTWSEAGHLIANHSYSHPNFGSKKATATLFEKELLLTDSIIQEYDGYTKLFRFPYLKAGSTIDQRDSYQEILKNHQYKNGHVTIDASDWYSNNLLIEQLNKKNSASFDALKEFYLDHLYKRALFYDSLSTALLNRKIPHNILLHHNLSASIFLDDLINKFKENNWEIIDAKQAFQDSVYQLVPKTLPAGEGLVWALCKESGKFNEVLRYPAESASYEKDNAEIRGLLIETK